MKAIIYLVTYVHNLYIFADKISKGCSSSGCSFSQHPFISGCSAVTDSPSRIQKFSQNISFEWLMEDLLCLDILLMPHHRPSQQGSSLCCPFKPSFATTLFPIFPFLLCFYKSFFSTGGQVWNFSPAWEKKIKGRVGGWRWGCLVKVMYIKVSSKKCEGGERRKSDYQLCLRMYVAWKKFFNQLFQTLVIEQGINLSLGASAYIRQFQVWFRASVSPTIFFFQCTKNGSTKCAHVRHQLFAGTEIRLY